ncbi:Hypothetical predicted protein [Lecanosticta acicola]|uniref:Uncharacterized protein n=1 Tax=Lecanosticta acicola TaxID=111012 RepID=A0AAI8W1H3_9PEZI|nr:Hypothetical predicted protein [Lecanosticta acicola]
MREASPHHSQESSKKHPGCAKCAEKEKLINQDTRRQIDKLKAKTNTDKFAEDSEGGDNGKDLKVCETISSDILIHTIVLARKYFSDDVKVNGATYMRQLMANAEPELIRYVGCLAMGGPNGNKDWEELLTHGDTRQALVVGIIGRALKEHVFGDLWFGGSPEQKEEIAAREESERFRDQLDGFARTRERANLAQKFAKADKYENVIPGAEIMAEKFDVLLRPFVHSKDASDLYDDLCAVIIQAGFLSRLMRQAPDVVFYWPPTFKDEEFEPSRMECLNLNDMITNSPYKKKTVGGIERAALIDDDPETVAKSEAIVRIVCFPGLVAYRREGGKLAEEEIAREKNRPDYAPADVMAVRRAGTDALTSETGFRSKVICKSVVFLQWGRQRLLTKEAGTSAHIDAMKNAQMDKYTQDSQGFKELWDIYCTETNRVVRQ